MAFDATINFSYGSKTPLRAHMEPGRNRFDDLAVMGGLAGLFPDGA